MTISLEEHVARAIWKAKHPLKPFELADARQREGVHREARAAIAAMREREGAKKDNVRPGIHCWGYGCILDETCVEYPRCSIRESERAACEAKLREMAAHAEKHCVSGVPPYQGRCNQFAMAYENAADAIAARKGNGEGK